MRSFIVSILGVAIFFIGLSALINDASAKFGSDAKALELIKKSRQAIGGDQAIDAVKSMTIVGKLDHLRTSTGEKKAGEIEINFQFPGKFAKTIKIGEPGDGADSKNIKLVETVVVSGDEPGDKDSKTNGDKHVLELKKDGEGKQTWTSGDGKTIVIERGGTPSGDDKDGEKEEIIIRKKGDGATSWSSKDGKTVIVEEKSDSKGEKEVWKTKDGNVITVDKIGKGDMHFQSAGSPRLNEFLKTTLALLMTAPEGSEVDYKFIGTGNVDGKASNIIEVGSKGATFKLFLDSSTNLPQMISYRQKHHEFVFKGSDKVGNVSKEKIIEMKSEMSDAKEVEHQIKFSNFLKEGKLNLPHRWEELIDGKPEQVINFTSFAINPSDIANKFNNEKVMIRKMRSKNDN